MGIVLSGGTVVTAVDYCQADVRVEGEKVVAVGNHISRPEVENRMGLLYTYGVVPGRISINQFVGLTSTQPAKLFGLFPRKGTIAAGSDADIVVWDPGASSVITARAQHQRVDYNPYEGFKQIGAAVHVFLRGRQVVRDGKLYDRNPGGVYLCREPFRNSEVRRFVHNRP